MIIIMYAIDAVVAAVSPSLPMIGRDDVSYNCKKEFSDLCVSCVCVMSTECTSTLPGSVCLPACLPACLITRSVSMGVNPVLGLQGACSSQSFWPVQNVERNTSFCPYWDTLQSLCRSQVPWRNDDLQSLRSASISSAWKVISTRRSMH